MSRYFQVPTGTTQNPIFGIIANNLKAPRTLVLSVFITACELSCEENKKAKNRDDLLEIIAYTLGDDQANIDTILQNLEKRGLIDDKGHVLGVETISEAAERKRRQRERERAARDRSRDGHVPVTPASRDERDPTNLTNQPKPINLNNPTNQPDELSAGQGSEGFSGMGELVGRLVGGQGRAFDVRDHLHDDDYVEIGQYMQGWDRKLLFDKYNAFVANDPPRSPKIAFIGWLKKFTKGKRP